MLAVSMRVCSGQSSRRIPAAGVLCQSALPLKPRLSASSPTPSVPLDTIRTPETAAGGTHQLWPSTARPSAPEQRTEEG